MGGVVITSLPSPTAPPDTFDPADASWRCLEWKAARLQNESHSATVQYLVVADSLRYKKGASAVFGDAVLVTDWLPTHISVQQAWRDGVKTNSTGTALEVLLTTYLDWLLMSFADFIIMPGPSGYSRTAFAMSQRPNCIHMENFGSMGVNSPKCASTGAFVRVTQRDGLGMGVGYR